MSRSGSFIGVSVALILVGACMGRFDSAGAAAAGAVVNPVVGFDTTCDSCTTNPSRYWCPVDQSCYDYSNNNNINENGGITENGQKQTSRGRNGVVVINSSLKSPSSDDCNTRCIGAFTRMNPAAAAGMSPEALSEAGRCYDLQKCFFRTERCADCAFAGGKWCIANSKCYAFASRVEVPDTINSSTVPASYLCYEECPDRVCIAADSDCPVCEQLRPPLTCGSLLPIFILSSGGTGAFFVMVAWCLYSYHRRRVRQREQEHEEQMKKEQRRQQRNQSRRQRPRAGEDPAVTTPNFQASDSQLSPSQTEVFS